MVTKNILLLDEHPQLYNLISESTEDLYILNWVETRAEWEDEREKLEKVDLIIMDPHFKTVKGKEILSALDELSLPLPVLLILKPGEPPNPLPLEWENRVFDFLDLDLPLFLILKRIENSLEIALSRKAQKQMNIEMKMAQQIQECMLPANIDQKNGLKIICWTRPLQIIGGDLYEYFFFRDKRLLFYIADVMTNGVSAALISMSLKILFANAIRISDDPGKILSIINYELGRILPHEFFITLFCGIINPLENTLIYANAGHSFPFCQKKEEIITLEESLPSLGPVRSFKYRSTEVPFIPGNKLLLYTDGVIERLNIKGEYLDNQYLFRIMMENTHSRDTYKALINALMFDREYQLKDDCSFIIIDFEGEPGSPGKG